MEIQFQTHLVVEQPQDEPRRSQRGYHPTEKGLENLVNSAIATDPSTRKEAMTGKEAKQWREAEIDEYKSQMDNKTFGPSTHLPKGRKAITPKVIFKTKRDGRKKARLVLRGFQMQAGQEFNETFAPVARITSMR